MSDRDVKLEDDHRDTHDEGGDDEVRAGSSCDSPALDPPNCRRCRAEELGDSSSRKNNC